MEVEFNGQRVQVLKDYGCNSNFVSFLFSRNHGELFRTVKESVTGIHSKKQSVEEESELILEGTVCIGTHTYVCNWVVESLIYDVLHENMWSVANAPFAYYLGGVIKFNRDAVPLVSRGKRKNGSVNLRNIGVK